MSSLSVENALKPSPAGEGLRATKSTLNGDIAINYDVLLCEIGAECIGYRFIRMRKYVSESSAITFRCSSLIIKTLSHSKIR